MILLGVIQQRYWYEYLNSTYSNFFISGDDEGNVLYFLAEISVKMLLNDDDEVYW